MIFTLTAIPVAWALNQFVFESGAVMWGRDAVFSWNQWAVEWANNTFPTNTRHYPQLLSANWSLTYQFIHNDEIQVFAKSIMPLFTLYVGLIGIDFFFLKRKFNFFTGFLGLLFAFFMIYFRPGFPKFTMGVADIPVAFMSFLSIHALIVAREASDDENISKFVLLAAILASGAAVTKQAGIYILLLFPLAVYLIVYRNNPSNTGIHARKAIFSYIFMVLVIVLPWYLYNEITILQGANTYDKAEKIFSSSGLFYGTDLNQRIIRGLSILEYYFVDKFILFALFAFTLFSISERSFCWIILLIIFPYTVIWSVFYPYDIRNLSIAVPFWGLAAGVGAGNLWLMVSQKLNPLKKVSDINQKIVAILFNYKTRKILSSILNKKIYQGVLAIIIVCMAGLSFTFDKSFLINRQTEDQKKYIGDFRKLNKKIYDYHEQKPISGKLISNYDFVVHFPELDCQAFALSDFKIFKNLVDRQDVSYILVVTGTYWGDYVAKEVRNWIRYCIKNGRYQVVLANQNGFLLKISERM